MNSQDLAFTAHDGDLKRATESPAPSRPRPAPTPCTSRPCLSQLAEGAGHVTPGDNDWTDCDRAKNGGFNSLERLDHERAVFFSDSFSLGQHRVHQEVQKTPLCLGVSGPEPCVENRRWTLAA